MEAGGVGVLTVVRTGQSRFGGGEEERSSGSVRIGGDKQGGGNDPGNNDRTVMREGVQSSNLTY